MTFETFLATRHPDVDPARALAALALIADGVAPLVVVRRHQAAPDGLTMGALARVLDAKERWDALRERQRFVLEEVDRQGRRTPELEAAIESTFDRETLDDLYVPFKRKRHTPGVTACEAGLGPLADWIWNCGHGLDTPLPGQTLELWAFTFRSDEHGIADAAQAIAGAEDVLVERLADMGSLRARTRALVQDEGWLTVVRGERTKDGSKFGGCFDLYKPIAWFRTPDGARRYLTIRRGLNQGELRLRTTGGPEAPDLMARMRALVEAEACANPDSPGAPVLRRAAARACEEQLWPAAELFVHKTLRALADDQALAEIEAQVRDLLTTSPFGACPVLGIDPALRGGSRIAVVDMAGNPVEHGTVHFDGEEKRAKAAGVLADLATRHDVQAVAIGDGIASKDALRLVRGALRAHGVLAPVVVVSEAGLAPWAAGEAARDELPAFDPTIRAAIGIARRLQDPLAELAKAEPRTLAGGPWVHDVSQPRLEKMLGALVASVVADVGVDVNAASDVLLARLPGITPGLAHAIVEYRAVHGPFPNRAALRAVPLMDSRAYEQLEPFVWAGDDGPPAVDPRGLLVPMIFGDDVRTLDALRVGLVCPGVVTNVTPFGAFVDIGLPHDGLVHVSRMADQFVQDPHAVIRVGDRVEVRVIEANREKQQIALSMKPDAPARPAARPPGPRERAEPRRERPGKPREPQRPAFNNPFAALVSQRRGGTPTDRSK